MTDKTIAIEARGLARRFGDRIVFEHVDLSVAEGQCVALTGANGAGKTTLLRCLASALRPSEGEVRWFGHAAAADPASRRLIALAAHEGSLYPHLTLRENLVFAARMCDVRRPARRADQWLRGVGLHAYARCLPGQVSKGMRQRLSLARALLHDPQIVLLDEPFSGLDISGTDWLLDLLERLLRRRRTLLFATHDLQITRLLADRVLRLRSKRVDDVEMGKRSPPRKDPTAARAA